MAAIDTPHIAYSVVSRFADLFASASATVIAWNDARTTRNALNVLSDRELSDIGLCRGDIDLIADGNTRR